MGGQTLARENVTFGRNRLISRLRYIVEQDFGTLKRRYSFDRIRYLGQTKTEMEFHLYAMAFNIREAVSMARLTAGKASSGPLRARTGQKTAFRRHRLTSVSPQL